MNESNLSDDALAELLTLTMEVSSRGTIRYYNHLGQLHREYGPAYISTDGMHQWYRNGKRHRTDGPAYVSDLLEKWFQDGKLNGNHGPAVTHRRHKQWYPGSDMEGPGVYSTYIEHWYVDGYLHREDGPAVINHAKRIKKWYMNGDQLSAIDIFKIKIKNIWGDG